VTREELAGRSGSDVSRETYDRITIIVALITQEMERQNLLSRDSVKDIWTRHVLDSTQLLRFHKHGIWLDLGTGAGFPGLIIAAFGSVAVMLVEERRLRHEFLSAVVRTLQLSNVEVIGNKLERVNTFEAGTISARAFAPIDKILRSSERFSSSTTRWILPKGKSASDELALAQTMWHGDFRLEPSVTDPNSSIIIAENISLKGRK
jgi:16S rRNA (guanine527-N7)-methyltransferase